MATKQKPLGKPRATAYLALLEKRLGKRKTKQIEARARELADENGERVVRFEFVAMAADVPLEQMVAELKEQGIRTSPKDVKYGSLNGQAKTAPKARAKADTAGKGGRGNARKSAATKQPSTATSGRTVAGDKREVKPDPKGKQTNRGSAKQSASSRKPKARRAPAAGSSRPSKTAQMRRQREQKASAAR